MKKYFVVFNMNSLPKYIVEADNVNKVKKLLYKHPCVDVNALGPQVLSLSRNCLSVRRLKCVQFHN